MTAAERRQVLLGTYDLLEAWLAMLDRLIDGAPTASAALKIGEARAWLIRDMGPLPPR